MSRSATLLGLAVALSLGCGGVEPIVGCKGERGIQPVCGFQNPEDLVALPSGAVLVSQMGAMDGSEPGSLVLFDPDGGGTASLFPAGGPGAPIDVAAAGPSPGWGDPACPGPPSSEFSPHGIDLVERDDGALALLVVNHGGREAIEFFEVAASRDTSVVWRGCVIPPEPHFMNDVVAFPDGSFVATHMLPKSGGLGAIYHGVRMLMGADTGYVIEWSPAQGVREVPGTKGGMPNGIAASPDGRVLYVNLYMAGEVRRVLRDGSEPPSSVSIPSPDNITWARDGRLLVASHQVGVSDMMACNSIEEGSCGIAFAIIALDPDTLETELVFENEGAPMGAGTAALHLGDELLIGSFAGDRIIRVKYRSPS